MFQILQGTQPENWGEQPKTEKHETPKPFMNKLEVKKAQIAL